MIKNIKLPVTFCREYSVSVSYRFFETDKMKYLWTCSRNLARKGGISLLGNDDEPIFRGHVLPDQPEYLLSFTSCFSKDKLIGLEMPLFYWPYLGSVRQESIVIIIKHHTYTHCTLRLYIHTHKLSSIFP